MVKFGRWQMLSDKGRSRLCRCECGTERLVQASDLKSGKSKSCGCLSREVSARLGKRNRKHGMDGTSEYRSWVDMRRRCHSPQRPDYKNYGARGIAVCNRWRFGDGEASGFECFFADMGRRPSPLHTIERKNNDGPYDPENCEWAVQKTQERNKRTNRLVEIDGVSMPVVAAAEKYGVRAGKIYSRLNRGWPANRAVGL